MSYLMILLWTFLGAIAEYNQEDIQGVTVIRERYPTKQHNVEFGEGYNSITLHRTYNSAVDVTRKHLLKDGYIECSFKIQLCKNRNEFFQTMKGGLSVSGSYMGLDVSASVKFLTETQITSLDSVLIASVDAITDTEIVTNVRYNAEGQALLDAGDYETFVGTYGTHYLRKIILGGKMMIIMKFSSSSKEEKLNLDEKLAISTGTFGAEHEFSEAMKSVHESSTLSVSYYIVGGNLDLPEPNVKSCIQYALDFAKSVLTYSAVREIEYAAMWLLPGTTNEFKNFIFPLQGQTDAIVRMSVELLNTKSIVLDLVTLKEADLSYITSKSWENIEAIGSEATELRSRLQNRFMTSYASEFESIIKEFNGTAATLDQKIESILKEEKAYDSTKTMYLKSAGTAKFISTSIKGYLRLDNRSPIPMTMKDIKFKTTGPHITIGRSSYNYIESKYAPGHVLCMWKNYWYVIWVRHSEMYAPYCQWRLAHSNSISKQYLEYGDRIIIYNRHWPDYIIGVSDNKRWLAAISASRHYYRDHQWVVEKGSSAPKFNLTDSNRT